MFRHSSRNRPLKLPSVPFSHGLPWREVHGVDSVRGHPAKDCCRHELGSAVERRYSGAPRTLTRRLSASMPPPDQMPPATSIARQSRVHSSITVKVLDLLAIGAAVEHEVVRPNLVGSYAC